MKFVALRDLQTHASRVLDNVKKGEDVVLTRLGKPEAALIRLTEDDLEEFILLRSPKLVRELSAAYREFQKKGGISQDALRQKLTKRRARR